MMKHHPPRMMFSEDTGPMYCESTPTCIAPSSLPTQHEEPEASTTQSQTHANCKAYQLFDEEEHLRSFAAGLVLRCGPKGRTRCHRGGVEWSAHAKGSDNELDDVAPFTHNF